MRKPKRGAVHTLKLDEIVQLRAAVRRWEDRPPATRGKRSITLLPQIVDGLRIGECLALRQTDLNLDTDVPTLTVMGTVVRVEETTPAGIVKGRLARHAKPKSDTSRRTITLPDFVVTALREAIGLGLDSGPDKLVFPSAERTPRSPGRVREQLRQAREGTGLKVRPHDFRRTIATRVANETTIGNATALLGRGNDRAVMWIGRTSPRTCGSSSINSSDRRKPRAPQKPTRSENGVPGTTKAPRSA
ncbi:tyrosine-type recombinase/integrase [Promicromonospora xylanilytica]